MSAGAIAGTAVGVGVAVAAGLGMAYMGNRPGRSLWSDDNANFQATLDSTPYNAEDSGTASDTTYYIDQVDNEESSDKIVHHKITIRSRDSTDSDYDYNYVRLKSSKVKNSLTVIKDFLIGRYLNTKLKLFPFFVETFTWYYYRNAKYREVLLNWKSIRNSYLQVDNNLTDDILVDFFNKCLIKQDSNISEDGFRNIRKHSDNIAFTQEYVIPAITLQKYIGDGSSYESDNDPFYNHVLIGLIIQIFLPLTSLHREYRNYDIDVGNIMVVDDHNKYDSDDDICFVNIEIYVDNIDTDPLMIYRTPLIKIIENGGAFLCDTPNGGTVHEFVAEPQTTEWTAFNDVLHFKSTLYEYCPHVITQWQRNHPRIFQLFESIGEKITDIFTFYAELKKVYKSQTESWDYPETNCYLTKYKIYECGTKEMEVDEFGK